MTDETAVLGIAATSQKGALTISRVVVRLRDDDSVEVEPLAAWQGTPRDEARSLNDLVDALANILDRKRHGAPDALAVKRTESPRGRPSNPYDQKIRAEAAAMIAASGQGRRYFQYRTNQLKPGQKLGARAAKHAAYPTAKEEREAVAAACTALAELANELED